MQGPVTPGDESLLIAREDKRPKNGISRPSGLLSQVSSAISALP